MARDRDDEHNRRDDRRQDDDYKVGRNRPPKHSQYRKDQSGNPKGRPKNSRNFKTDLLSELTDKITVHVDGKKKRLPRQQAVIKRLVANAIQGDTKAVSTLTSMLAKFASEEMKAEPSPALNESQSRVLESYRERLKAEIREELTQEQRRAENALGEIHGEDEELEDPRGRRRE